MLTVQAVTIENIIASGLPRRCTNRYADGIRITIVFIIAAHIGEVASPAPLIVPQSAMASVRARKPGAKMRSSCWLKSITSWVVVNASAMNLPKIRIIATKAAQTATARVTPCFVPFEILSIFPAPMFCPV